MSTTRPIELPTPTAFRLRHLDLAAVAAGDPEARRDHDALIRRGAIPDPDIREPARTTLADVRIRGFCPPHA